MGSLAGRFTVCATGLKVVGQPSFEQWMAFRDKLHEDHRGIHWAVGDWLRYGEDRFGETYAQALTETEFCLSTLQTAKYVSGRFPPPRRKWPLGHSFYETVASVTEDAVQDELLQRALNEEWSRERLRDEARPHKPKRSEPAWTAPAPEAEEDEDEDEDEERAELASPRPIPGPLKDPVRYPDAPGANLDAAAQDALEGRTAPHHIIRFPVPPELPHVDMDIEDFRLLEAESVPDALESGPVYLRGRGGKVVAVVTSFPYHVALETVRTSIEALNEEAL